VVLAGPAGAGRHRVGDEGEDDGHFARPPQGGLERRGGERHHEVGPFAERGVDQGGERRHVALRVANPQLEVAARGEAGLREARADPRLGVLDVEHRHVFEEIDPQRPRRPRRGLGRAGSRGGSRDGSAGARRVR
jgi:hypothetical protein